MKSRDEVSWLEPELRAALAGRHPSPDFAWRAAARAVALPARSSDAARSRFGSARAWRFSFSLAAGLIAVLALSLSLRPPAPAPRAKFTPQAQQVQHQLQFAFQFTRVRLRRIVLRALPGLHRADSQRGETL